MAYEKTLIDTNGEEYPYCVSFDGESYFYKISVVWKNRDGELNILNEGSHIEFDDDGSWLDFDIVPEKIFPNKDKLSETDLLLFIKMLESPEKKMKVIIKEKIEASYQKYLKTKRY
jgi:hypothetical protein